MDITEHFKSLQTEESKEYCKQKELEWAEREAVCAPLRDAADFILSVKDWNFVDKVGFPAYDEWCFIITESQSGCLYDWGVGGYSAEHKTFYVNYGLGGLVTEQEHVIAWKAFTDFENDFNGMNTEFLTVITGKKVAETTTPEKQELSYGIIKKYENGTALWFEPVTDEKDGFVLRKSGSKIQSAFSEKRDTYIMDRNDPGVIAVYAQRDN